MSAPDGFRVRCEQDGDRTVIVLEGDLDGVSVPAFRRYVDGTPFGSDTLVDLAGVGFIDSEGLGCLFRLQQRVADAGGLLVGRGPSPSVRRAMEIVQLNRVMAIVDD